MKTKKVFFPRQLLVSLSLLAMLLFMGALLKAAIPASEREALIALYNSTAGDNWNDRSGWKTGVLAADGFAQSGTEGSWFGVTVSGDHVTRIQLVSNNLYGTLSPQIGNLTHLDFLKIRYNNMWGAIPAQLGNLAMLTQLDLVQNHFTGSIPPELGDLKSLRTLYIQDPTLQGSIPVELGKLSNLESLTILAMYTSGPLPAELGNLSKLQTLHIKRVQVNGEIPAELWNLTNLRSLTLYECGITGTIPPEIGNLTKLEYLDLARNNLSGSIPDEITLLTALKYIDLSWNELSGSLPAEISNLMSLETLRLMYNSLTGPIPPGLGNIVSLTYLSLYKNQLECTIPSELGNLVNLTELDLKCCRLYGCIPSTLTNLKRLTYLNLGNNCLYTNDGSLRYFLSSQSNYSWADQTVAPANLSVDIFTSTSLELKWFPISYLGPGGYQVYYSQTSGGPWTYAGMTENKSASSFALDNLTAGAEYYFIVKTQSDADTWCIDSELISEAGEELHVQMPSVPAGQDQPPFGAFDSPESSNIPVSGSIAVTGWALDDINASGVKIYCLKGGTKIFIGDAVFVEGARPDVQAVYPEYPNSSRAGWGYMMLTNFLPNGGNGIYNLQAVATDYVGHETILGTKTIVVDNVNAVKPFGAIDAPAQGGTAAGYSFANFGWALTPQPNLIPFNGQTISVWVDGRPIGHPNYNNYREDIATLFPGYRNSNGASGYLYLNTMDYANGVHTIAWSVRDDAGNTDGIGSRYFNIFNESNADKVSQSKQGNSTTVAQGSPGSHGSAGSMGTAVTLNHLDIGPLDTASPIGVLKGFRRDTEPQSRYPGGRGETVVSLKPMERVEIHLREEGAPDDFNVCSGYLIQDGQLNPLPIGSSLDRNQGIFYWQPGPGFAGEYRLVFMEKDINGNAQRKQVAIRILLK